MTGGRHPRVWTVEELQLDREEATRIFRDERLTEPLEIYLDAFRSTQADVERYLEQTTDLRYLEEQATILFNEPRFLEFLRYLAGPPISTDDLSTLLENHRFNATVMKKERDARTALIEIIRTGLDRERFPWVLDGREPLESEKKAAIIATCALIATQRTQTARRRSSGNGLELALKEMLRAAGMVEAEPPATAGSKRKIKVIQGAQDFPAPGEFYGKEIMLRTRKIDVMARTWNSILILCECKASSSELNSIKRLSNDTVAKAAGWAREFGTIDVAPIAVLSGRYSLKTLQAAQRSGLFIVWGHRLTDLAQWIESTRSG